MSKSFRRRKRKNSVSIIVNVIRIILKKKTNFQVAFSEFYKVAENGGFLETKNVLACKKQLVSLGKLRKKYFNI